MARKRRRRRNAKAKVIVNRKRYYAMPRRRRRRNPPPLMDAFLDAGYATGGFFATKILVPKAAGLLNVDTQGIVGIVVQLGTSYVTGLLGERFLNRNAGKMIFVGGLLGTLANFITERGLLPLEGYNIDRSVLCPQGITMGQLPPGDITEEQLNSIMPADQPVLDSWDMPERLRPRRVQ